MIIIGDLGRLRRIISKRPASTYPQIVFHTQLKSCRTFDFSSFYYFCDTFELILAVLSFQIKQNKGTNPTHYTAQMTGG